MTYGVILGALGASLLFCIVIALIRSRYNKKVVHMNSALEQLLHKKEIEYSDNDDNRGGSL